MTISCIIVFGYARLLFIFSTYNEKAFIYLAQTILIFFIMNLWTYANKQKYTNGIVLLLSF